MVIFVFECLLGCKVQPWPSGALFMDRLFCDLLFYAVSLPKNLLRFQTSLPRSYDLITFAVVFEPFIAVLQAEANLTYYPE